MPTDVLYRNSSNLVIVEDLVDWNDRDATSRAPTPVIADVIVTAQVFSPDRATPLHPSPVNLVQEDDQPQNYYRGILPSTVDYGDYTEASVLFVIDGGSVNAYLELWHDVKVVEES